MMRTMYRRGVSRLFIIAILIGSSGSYLIGNTDNVLPRVSNNFSILMDVHRLENVNNIQMRELCTIL